MDKIKPFLLLTALLSNMETAHAWGYRECQEKCDPPSCNVSNEQAQLCVKECATQIAIREACKSKLGSILIQTIPLPKNKTPEGETKDSQVAVEKTPSPQLKSQERETTTFKSVKNLGSQLQTSPKIQPSSQASKGGFVSPLTKQRISDCVTVLTNFKSLFKGETESGKQFLTDVKDLKREDIKPSHQSGAENMGGGRTINFIIKDKYFVQFFMFSEDLKERKSAEGILETQLKGKESIKRFVRPLILSPIQKVQMTPLQSAKKQWVHGVGIYPLIKGKDFSKDFTTEDVKNLGEAFGQLLVDSYNSMDDTVLMYKDLNEGNYLHSNNTIFFIDYGDLERMPKNTAKTYFSTLVNGFNMEQQKIFREEVNKKITMF
jgi:hypothetical protein